MEFIILKNNLKEGLNSVSGARKESSSLPALRNIIIETEGGKIKISSTDLEIGVTCLISAKISKEGSVVIPFSIFSQIINNISEERINFEISGKSVVVSTDNYKAKISTFPKDEFPIIPDISDKKENHVKFSKNDLINSLSSIIPACQISDLRPELSGIFFSYNGDSIKFVATDSFRLAEKTF